MSVSPVVEFKSVSVQIDSTSVLEDITFSIPGGSMYAIIGPNGSGKTTLVKTMLGLIESDGGEIDIFSQKVEKPGCYRKPVGYLPQGLSVDMDFPVTVRQVVIMTRYGKLGLFHRPKQEDYVAVDEALRRVGIEDLADRPVGALSGGQRQRVFLARALASEPELLILDEPTTGVDISTSESFYGLLQKLKEDGITIILVTHDVGVVAEYADYVACLNKKLVEHGAPCDVLSGDAIEQMYGEHAAAFPHGKIPHKELGEQKW